MALRPLCRFGRVGRFQTCCELPHFKAVLGAVKLCDSQAKVPEKAPEPKAKAEVKAAPKAAAASAADVEACGNQIRELKALEPRVERAPQSLEAKLKEQGLSGKQINVHPEVTALVEQLQALKAAEPKAEAKAAPKAEAKAAPKAEATASRGLLLDLLVVGLGLGSPPEARRNSRKQARGWCVDGIWVGWPRGLAPGSLCCGCGGTLGRTGLEMSRFFWYLD